MSEIRNLTRNGETFYPLTTTSAVINENTGSGLVIDDEPTPNSENLVKSGGIANAIPSMPGLSKKDFTLSDEKHYVLLEINNGHIKTKNFDSKEIKELLESVTNSLSVTKYDLEPSDLQVKDENDYVLIEIRNGHIKTKNFDSRNITFGNKDGIDFGFLNDNGLYSFIIKDGHIRTKNFNSRLLIPSINAFNYNKFNGKRLAVVGDSISTFDGTLPDGYSTYYPRGNVDNVKYMWWSIVCKNLGMVCTNTAWSGSWVTGAPKGNSAKPACSDIRINDVGRNGTPDYIIIYIGINDFGQERPLGNWRVTDPIIDDSNYSESDTINQFRAAFSLMIDKLHRKYKRARIFVCSLPDERYSESYEAIEGWPSNNEDGVVLSEYNNSIREIATAMGCVFINLASCGIHYYNQDTYMVDGGLHPNIEGQSLIGNYITSQIIINS